MNIYKNEIVKDFDNNSFIKLMYKKLKQDPSLEIDLIEMVLIESYKIGLFNKYNKLLNNHNKYFNAEHILFRNMLLSFHSYDIFLYMFKFFDIDYKDPDLLYISDNIEEFKLLIANNVYIDRNLLNREIDHLFYSSSFKTEKIDILISLELSMDNCVILYNEPNHILLLKYLISKGLTINGIEKYKLCSDLTFTMDIITITDYFNLSDRDSMMLLYYKLFELNLMKHDDFIDINIINSIKTCIDYIEKKYNLKSSNYSMYNFIDYVYISKFF
jgi:hypothetical protein